MDQLIKTLRAVIGRDAVLADQDELLVYECDGLTHHKHIPRAVVFPSSTEETSEVMRVLGRAGVPFTPRGAGTGLSGGALALERGVVVELARLRRILRIDEANRLAVVQTGVVNLQVSRAVAHLNLHYVPDPSSQHACTIGGNIGENAGGVHCLKYGTTTDHVLAIRVVLAGGEIVDLGGPVSEQPGYDLRGVFIGSEGTFGIATEATLRLVPIPPTVRTLLAEFPEVNDASHAVSAIIAAGLVPAGLEMMDREIIRAVEASVFAAGLPLDAGAALLIELDGLAAGIDNEAERVTQICLQYGARNCRLARDERERIKLWAARKGAFGAVGRIAPDSMIQDAVVPRSRLPQIMTDAYQIASKYQLRLANVFHAGDGNLHPLICFDSRSADEVRRVKEAGRELMETCVRAGGSITGEHGVGLDKRELLSLIFSDDDMEAMLRVRAAFDPTGLMNPGKIIPLLRGCGEARAVSALGSTARGSTGGAETVGRRGPGLTADVNGGPSEMSGLSVSPKNEEAGQPEIKTKTATFNLEFAFDQLASIIGDQNVTISSFPCSQSEVLTASPASIAEACEIIKLAAKAGWAVVPAGKGSWLEIGNQLNRVNVIISTLRLNRIIEHEPADLIAVTEAGVLLSRFNQALTQNGQWLPLDLAGYSEGTIGGHLATGISGPQCLGYGPPRAFVIGLKVVLSDGKLIKAGGRVVKNVAGYDLCKLFTGSYGTLGLIVEANFKLRPRPESEATVIASGPAGSLIAAAHEMLSIPLFPVAVELLSSTLAQTESPNPLLLVRFAGNQEAVQHQAETALSLLGKSDQISERGMFEQDLEIWQQLATKDFLSEKQISWRATIPPAEVPSLIDHLSPTNTNGLRTLRWHAGIVDGRIQGSQEFQAETSIEALRKLRNECQRLNGSLVIESSPLQVKEQLGAWGALGKAAAVMQRIKHQLDPENLFSPGRFGF